VSKIVTDCDIRYVELVLPPLHHRSQHKERAPAITAMFDVIPRRSMNDRWHLRQLNQTQRFNVFRHVVASPVFKDEATCTLTRSRCAANPENY
jgi:hypothetical protein